jgi:prephenate dehydrogenase
VKELPVIQPSRRPNQGPAPIFNRIGIVGLGLIGGSIALAARELWPAALVIAVDNKDVLEAAMRIHAIDVAADNLIVLAEADLVVLAAPVRQNLAILDELDEFVRQPAVITDTGSTKRDIVRAAKRLPPRFTFVGGHPLGGAAVSGLDHARPDLFRGRPWLFTPDRDAAGDGLEKLLEFTRMLGAVPRIVTATEHDRLLAFLSHLPQLTASALMQIVGETVGAEGLALAGRGLIDTTRLAGSPPEIWKDITATNADQIGPALDRLIDVLTSLRRDLAGGDRLAEIFADAAAWRQQLVDRKDV